MLYMVIEHFRNADPAPIRERFRRDGRMMPDGLIYHASWIEPNGTRCFQLMETADPALFEQWTNQWDDLMEFEIIPVLSSADFWSQFQPSP